MKLVNAFLGCVFAVCPLAAVACTPTPAPSGGGDRTATLQPALTEVSDHGQVCMVNDRYMGKEQIPVVVDGRTYFGCCEGCKERLRSDAMARTGLDPVSGKPVDKALAVIAYDDSGKVFYFESETTLRRYRP